MRGRQKTGAKTEKKPSGLQPYQHERPRIRRNAPCQCGSGLKAKDCCLPRIKTLESIPPARRAEFLTAAILQKPIVNLEPAGNLDANVQAAVETMKTKTTGENDEDTESA